MKREDLRVVVADAQPIVRRGVRALLHGMLGFHVVAEADDLETTRRLLATHRPDLLVVELRMPDGSTLDALPELCELSPATRIVLFTREPDLACIRPALRAGASAYVLKDNPESELVGATRAASSGGTYIAPDVGAALARSQGRTEELSPRETEVLTFLARGFTNREVGEALFISARTVESHRAHIGQKLGRTARHDLVSYALEHGLLEGEPAAQAA